MKIGTADSFYTFGAIDNYPQIPKDTYTDYGHDIGVTHIDTPKETAKGGMILEPIDPPTIIKPPPTAGGIVNKPPPFITPIDSGGQGLTGGQQLGSNSININWTDLLNTLGFSKQSSVTPTSSPVNVTVPTSTTTPVNQLNTYTPLFIIGGVIIAVILFLYKR